MPLWENTGPNLIFATEIRCSHQPNWSKQYKTSLSFGYRQIQIQTSSSCNEGKENTATTIPRTPFNWNAWGKLIFGPKSTNSALHLMSAVRSGLQILSVVSKWILWLWMLCHSVRLTTEKHDISSRSKIDIAEPLNTSPYLVHLHHFFFLPQPSSPNSPGKTDSYLGAPPLSLRCNLC